MRVLLTSGIELHSDLKDYTADELKTLGRVLQLFGQAQDMRFRAHWDGQVMFLTIPTRQIQFVALEQPECEALEQAMNPPEAAVAPIGDGPLGPPLTQQ